MPSSTGPWRIVDPSPDHDYLWITAPGSYGLDLQVASLRDGDGDFDKATVMANAKLIAQSPSAIRALRDIHAVATGPYDNDALHTIAVAASAVLKEVSDG